ncbi:MAG: alpha-ketoacid dehydrogenase subunit beta [Thermoflexales bacterium]|nr:alpha-ketoacid dehydrogenase subunit beta [Thermoflexales bacterium]
MADKTLIEGIREALDEEMARDERVIVIGTDIGVRGGVFLATQGLYAKYGPNRILDAPLAESSIVGVGIGAAMNGLRPVCEIQFADFIHPAYNQIANEAARMFYRTGGQYPVPMVIRAPYGGGVGGGLYHSQSIEATFAHVPGLKVVIPATPADAKGLLKTAIRDNNPTLFLEPKKGYRMIRGPIPEDQGCVPFGEARVSRPGRDLTVLAYGMMHFYALQAAESAAKEGLDVEVVDLRTLNPLDSAGVLASVRRTGKALIAYEDNKFVGYGAELAAQIAEDAFTALDAPLLRVAAPDAPAAPYSHPLQDAFLPGPRAILDGIRTLARY